MTDAMQEQLATAPGNPTGAPSEGPVTDWATDYDVLDVGYVTEPYPIWDRLRQECPVAHSDRWGGSWMPTRYADVAAVAHDVARFSSRDVGVVGGGEEIEGMPDIGLPPIDADPPFHTSARRLILPWFSHNRVDGYASMTREPVRRAHRPRHRHRARRCRPGLRPADPGARDLVDAGRARRARRHVHGLGARRARARPRPCGQRPGVERHRRLLHQRGRGTSAPIPATTSSATSCGPRSTANRCPTCRCSARSP